MPVRLLPTLSLFFLSTTAHAGSFGVGLAFVQDLPDAGADAPARLGPGFSLQLPARIDLTSHAALRVGGRLTQVTPTCVYPLRSLLHLFTI